MLITVFYKKEEIRKFKNKSEKKEEENEFILSNIFSCKIQILVYNGCLC